MTKYILASLFLISGCSLLASNKQVDLPTVQIQSSDSIASYDQKTGVWKLAENHTWQELVYSLTAQIKAANQQAQAAAQTPKTSKK